MRWLALALFVAPPSDVWLVDARLGPGADFPEIQLAVDAAGDGDLILVRSGVYGAFEIDTVSLTVVADAGADVVASHAVLRNDLAQPGDGGPVVLRGVTFDVHAPTGVFGSEGLTAIGAGTIWVEDCRTQGDPGCPSALVGSTRSAAFSRCHLAGGDNGDGLFVQEALAFHAYGSVVEGGLETALSTALRLSGSTVELRGCLVRGGAGVDGDAEECAGGDGAPGLVVVPSAFGTGVQAGFHGTRIFGGPGGAGFGGCPDGLDGPAFGSGVSADDLAFAPGALRELEAASPVRAGATVAVTLRGVEGDLAWLLVSGDAAAEPLALDGVDGPYQLGVPDAVLFEGALPAGGALTVEHVAPAPQAGAGWRPLQVQALFRDARGGLHLSNPSSVAVLAER